MHWPDVFSLNSEKIDQIHFALYQDQDVNGYLGECTQFEIKSLILGQSQKFELAVKGGGKFGFRIILASVPEMEDCVCSASEPSLNKRSPADLCTYYRWVRESYLAPCPTPEPTPRPVFKCGECNDHCTSTADCCQYYYCRKDNSPWNPPEGWCWTMIEDDRNPSCFV